MAKIVWIIGGSSGIGLELLQIYLSKHDKVICSSRNLSQSSKIKELKNSYPNNLHLVDIDVTDTTSVKEAVTKVWGIYFQIDLCIYNAGAYEPMSLKEWSLQKFQSMNEVNYLGAVRLLTELVPLLQEQKKGHIAFNASIASYFGLPYGGGYSAPKAALLNLCESIYPELKNYNIKLQVINHGFVKTRLTDKNNFDMPQLLEPSDAAQKIYEGLQSSNKFEIKFPRGLTSFLFFLRLLPYKIAFYLTTKAL